MSAKPLRVGLLGAGTVGGALARLVGKRPALGIEVVGAYVRDIARTREGIRHLTTEPFQLLDDESVDAVVEVLGGDEPARSLILAAFERGKHVVTANKLVLATHWGELMDAAKSARRELRYEGSVGGVMPVVATLRALAGTKVRSLEGILNGTTNYILGRMEADGASFDDALVEAQRAGFAEADPSSDVDGWDGAYKLAIAIATLERRPFDPEHVERTSLRTVTPHGLADARSRGKRLRYVAMAQFRERAVKAWVGPQEVDETSVLASVRGPENALRVLTEDAGLIQLTGTGAGGDATATAILGDLLALGPRR